MFKQLYKKTKNKKKLNCLKGIRLWVSKEGMSHIIVVFLLSLTHGETPKHTVCLCTTGYPWMRSHVWAAAQTFIPVREVYTQVHPRSVNSMLLQKCAAVQTNPQYSMLLDSATCSVADCQMCKPVYKIIHLTHLTEKNQGDLNRCAKCWVSIH